MWLVVGLVAFLLVLAFVRDLKVLRDYRFLIGILGLLLLLFTAVFGREINGARLWVNIGPISFQPAEFAKILLVIFFAAYLVDIREVLTVSTRRVLGVPLPPFRYLAPLLTIWALSMALMIFMKDLGTSLLFFGALLALLYVATGRFFYVLVGLVLFVAGAASALLRLPPRADPGGHLARPLEGPERQGLPDRPVAVRAGRRGAVRPRPGPGVSHPASRATPSSPTLETDFIFSAIGEELGLVGAVGIILLYLIFTYRGFRIAVQARDDFRRLLATGLTSIFALQAFLIMGGVIKLIPLTGITLPFVSYGGSSIVANFVLLALLLRMSDSVEPERQTGRPSRARTRPRDGGVDGQASPPALPLLRAALRGSAGAAHLRAGVGRAQAQGRTRPTPGPSRRR